MHYPISHRHASTCIGLSPIGRRCLLWLCVIGISGCAPSQIPSSTCADTDRACAYRAGTAHVVKKRAFWAQALAQPLARRIGAAPPELVDLMRLANISQSIPNRPRAAALTPEFVAEVSAALDELPQSVKSLLTTKLAGIYFIDDIGGTGFADTVFDAHGAAVAGFVVLDPSVLRKRSANEWATWKENTPFTPSEEYRLRAEIEVGHADNRKNAIQYILLHELAHVISIGAKIHPSWNIAPKDVVALSSYPFFQLSWTRSKDGNAFESLFDAAFPQRKRVVYYFGAKLGAAQMQNTYTNLEQTNFVTLYGATGPSDDFAEAFANYVHSVLLKRPFAIRLYRGGTEVKMFTACWDQPRCAAKRELLEGMLGGG